MNIFIECSIFKLIIKILFGTEEMLSLLIVYNKFISALRLSLI